MIGTSVRAGILTLVVLVLAAPLGAQSTGAFVTRLGVDTLAVERFTRSASRMEGDVLLFVPQVRVIRYQVDFAPDGAVRTFGFEQRAPNDTLPPAIVRIAFDADSIRTTVTRGAQVTNRAGPGQPDARPHGVYFWALYELETESFARAPADSVTFWMVPTGGGPAVATVFRRRAPDTLSTTWFQPEYHLDYAFDRGGRLMGLNGLNTTIKMLVERLASVPFDDLVARATERERASGPRGAASTRDSTTTTVGGTAVTLVYSRPLKRGRTIWGGVVPFDQVWRTGANAATRFSVSAPVRLGEIDVPAGDYTLYSLPTATGAQLIVNRQFGQWGTEYHAEQDLARIPVRVERLATLVEQFTFLVREAAGGAELVLEWDQVRWVIPMRTGQGGH